MVDLKENKVEHSKDLPGGIIGTFYLLTKVSFWMYASYHL